MQKTNNMKTKPFYSINKSKAFPELYRIVQWFGKHPNIYVETVQDGIGYDEAVMILENLKK